MGRPEEMLRRGVTETWDKKMMVASALSLTVNPPGSPLLLPLLSSSSSSSATASSSSRLSASGVRFKHSLVVEKAERRLASKLISCRAAAAEYKFPDPIPEFADAETEKFRNHLLTKLSKKDIYGDSVEQVVRICTEIFSTFLNTEYGGPGTLLVLPFIDMADTLNERGLPGGPQAARVAVKWAQNHVDKDWNEWTGGDDN